MSNRPVDMTDLESLLNKNASFLNYQQRWHPCNVDIYERAFKRGEYEGMDKEVRKNIAYSLQYLEYMQLQYDELYLHSVIEKQLMKNYIVISMSIIESIFHHIVIKSGFRKVIDWNESKPVHTNIFSDGNSKKKYLIVEATKMSEPQPIQMDFEYLINKIQEKKLLSITSKMFPYLKYLKRIRNKVHLQIVNYENDTDYLSINKCDYYMAKFLLYTIIRDNVFDPKPTSCFDFLKLTEDEKTVLRTCFSRNKSEV